MCVGCDLTHLWHELDNVKKVIAGECKQLCVVADAQG